jgi:hypothetical protein
MLRIAHRLYNRLADGGRVVSNIFLCFWYLFLLGPSEPQGLLRPGGLGKLKEIIHLFWSRTCDLPACNIVP